MKLPSWSQLSKLLQRPSLQLRLRLAACRNHSKSTSGDHDDMRNRINSTIAGSPTSNSVLSSKFKPDPETTQSDWISWLSRQVDYERYFEDALESRKMEALRTSQEFSAERKVLLGGELACARFVVSLRGKVKLYGDEHWYCAATAKAKPLPIQKTPGLVVEAIDLSNSLLIYEGVENLMQAQSLLHLNLSECSQLDEWAVTQLSLMPSLVSLNLSGNQFLNERCLLPLHHLPNLRRLDLGQIDYFKNQPMALIALEEMLPDCVIVNVEIPDPATPT